jgi:hypothetical protein
MRKREGHETMDETTRAKHSGAADRWMQEQLFEEDVRAVLNMMRPHRGERLHGWSEYRTGGANFRVTISWDEDFAQDESEHPGETLPADGHLDRRRALCVPQMAKVLETILVGSARDGDELTPQEEFALYRSVADELRTRIDELQDCYS